MIHNVRREVVTFFIFGLIVGLAADERTFHEYRVNDPARNAEALVHKKGVTTVE